jgi:N-acetylmuramoyl-L-alanine amidase
MRNIRIVGYILITLIFYSLAAFSNAYAAPGKVKTVNFWPGPENTRVVVRLSAPAYYLYDPKTNVDRFGITFKNTLHTKKTERLTSENDLLDFIYIENTKENNTRITIKLKAKANIVLIPVGKNPSRVSHMIIEIPRPATLPPAKLQRDQILSMVSADDKIVIIDPGHGGSDFGATGQHVNNNVIEKDVVLETAYRLQELLNAIPGVKAVLTREGDYFVSLSSRIKITHKIRDLLNTSKEEIRSSGGHPTGDVLFFSLHINAPANKWQTKAKGTEVYYLSQRKSTDETVSSLVAAENASELLSGYASSSDNEETAQILMSMTYNKYINDSTQLAHLTMNALGELRDVTKRGVKSANFAVLKNYSIPSILVELAFATNPREAELLNTDWFQIKACYALSNSIIEFFHNAHRDFDPKRFDPKKVQGTLPQFVEYKIKRGDSLSLIASKHGVKVDDLLKANNLRRNSTIFAGRRILIPKK